MTPWAIAAGDFTPLGGMDRANYGLARYLATAGRDVHLIAHRVWEDLQALPHVTVHRVRRPLGSHLLGAPLLARAAAKASDGLPRGARLLANGGNTRWTAPTWIHYLHAAYEPDAADARARLVTAAGRRRNLEQEAAAIANAPAVICNSKRTADDVRRCYAVDATSLHVVYYGTDAAQFASVDPRERAEARSALGCDPGRPLAVFIGALGDRRKGFDVLFEAWRTLSAGPSWDVDLAVAGAGAEAPRWMQRAHTEGIESRVRFLDFRPDVSRVLAAADLLVHPARYEAYGLGVHEAICRGVPAIVSATAGVAERFPAELAPLTLSDPTSVDGLVERLRLWRRDVDGWRQRVGGFGAQLRRRSWDEMAAEIAAIVERL